ncbi:MAG: hypothetical protein RJA44_1918 [Pseudomonadota bacterium]
MMKMKMRRTLVQAAVLAASTLVASLSAACPVDSAKPFTAGPLDAQGMFPQWIVDSNGVGLSVCTDSLTADGNPPPCFYDPIVPGNALSQALGRGGEAFYFLADSVFTTTDRTGAQGLDAVIVMAVESAFLSAEPTAGFQTQFQRLRTRVNVAKVGIYTVETPWGTKTYRVDTLLPPGNGQNRSEISDPVDITFGPGSVPGMVAPFLIANPVPAGFNGYIGDGLTPTKVTGSPCGQNYVKVTAVGLDGVTPVDINNGSNVYINDQFTVMGKLAPTAAVPLSIGSAYYTRNAGTSFVTVMAEGSTSSTLQATATVNVGDTAAVMARDATRFYASVPVTGVVPATISVTAADPGRPSTPNTQTATLTDLVTIGRAEARCSGTGLTRNCLLTVDAGSSDDGSGPNGAPTLTLVHANTVLLGGTTSVNSAAVPASVSVSSSFGGVASKPVTLINQ